MPVSFTSMGSRSAGQSGAHTSINHGTRAATSEMAASRQLIGRNLSSSQLSRPQDKSHLTVDQAVAELAGV
jgi:hypothetical protein